MLIVLEQLVILYIFLCLGWFFGKVKKGLTDQTGMLSFLLVNLFLPCKVFGNFSANFTVAYISEHYRTILISLGLLIFLHFFAKLPAHFLKKSHFEKQVYEYSITISNYAYLGYALIESIYGSQALTNMLVFCIPFSLYTYTVGYIKLTGSGNPFKRLLNPMTGAMVVGIAFGLSGLQLPDFLTKAVSNAAACLSPASMLLTGMVLSTFALKDLLCNVQAYILVALRLVGVPALVYLLLKGLRLNDVLPYALMMTSMPTGLNTIIFAKNAGQSPNMGARFAFISHLSSLITLPFWLSLLK